MAARKTIDELLARSRAGLVRVEPHEVPDAIRGGALLIDIRSESQRAADGTVPGALWVARNVLEWRCDPSCEAHDDRVGDLARHVIVMCDEGYQSSLAAATLQELGFGRATDLVGGFRAWRAAGLPVAPSWGRRAPTVSAMEVRCRAADVRRERQLGQPPEVRLVVADQQR